jgi:hypothetical protein
MLLPIRNKMACVGFARVMGFSRGRASLKDRVERDAFWIVFLKPRFRGVFVRERARRLVGLFGRPM